MSIVKEQEASLWDDRRWLLSLKANEPIKVYEEMVNDAEAEPGLSPEEVSPEQQAWLRQT